MIVLIVFEDYLVALPRREMPYLELSLILFLLFIIKI